jgi:hypothetical protein
LNATIIDEGDEVDVVVTEPGGTGTFSFSETEDETTDVISLGVTLPTGTTGTITVATLVEDDLESGTVLATAADIDASCTGFCTIQFTVPNSLLEAAGLTPESASIYRDSNENGFLEEFTALVEFNSAFGVGGKSGSAGASSTGASSSGFSNSKCDSSAFGRGNSIRVYEISYDICETEKLDVVAESRCGPAYLSVLYDGGMTRGGLSMTQPYLDEHKVLLSAPISSDYNKFRVLVENDKSYYDKLIIPKKLHGLVTECKKTITISHETGYLSNQTSSFGNFTSSLSNQTSSFGNFTSSLSNQTSSSNNSTKLESEKVISPRKIISFDESSLGDTFFEFENDNVGTNTPVYVPEPCVDTWNDSCWEPKSSNDDELKSTNDNDDKLYLLSWVFDLFESK